MVPDQNLNMALKVILLVIITLLFYTLGYFLLRGRMKPYHPLTWALVEGFWYFVSFLALCIGLAELERIEKLDDYKAMERSLDKDYENKRGLLYAQSWILKIDKEFPEHQKEGVMWFHKMRASFEEGMKSPRWKNFLAFSSSYMHHEQRSDLGSRALEYGWPLHPNKEPDSLYLHEEINWMIDSLNTFSRRMDQVEKSRPEENTNYRIRYFMIVVFLLALAMKFLKIYADYRRNRGET